MSDIYNLINECNSILILGHKNPDGDAVGSAMAMYHYLTSLNKSVDILFPEIPPTFLFLNDIDKIIKESSKEYDLAIVVDCANKDRIGQNNNEFENCKKSVVIDHHASNTKYGDINYVEEDTASCSQVIYYMFKNWDIAINKDIGECLMTGCITDTAGFRNNNVDKKTFLMAADMMDYGVNIHKVYYEALTKKNMARYILMKLVLDRLEMYEDNKIAFSYLSEEDLENAGALPGDHVGLVDLGRNIDGVEVSIFIREENGYHISLRSNGKVNVNNIAAKFGGGGHIMAAGAMVNTSFKETKNLLIEETIKELNNTWAE